MKLKNTIALVGTTSGISYLAYRTISNKLFNKTFTRYDKGDLVEQKYLDWIDSCKKEQISIESFDGLKLNAYDVCNHDTHKYMIVVHGIWSSKTFMYPRAYEFDKLGYNMLLIDQRAAGDSEGKYYTYGLKESQDLQQWIDYLIKKDPEVQICLFGLSMGAATVMMATSYDLPANVRCIVEDCGYSSLREEFDHIVRHDYKISFTVPVLMSLEKKMKDQFGFGLDDISPKTCLENNEIPILFVHGKDDSFVPFDMAKILYNHNKGIKKYYPVPNARHTEANIDENYYSNIDTFINTYFNS